MHSVIPALRVLRALADSPDDGPVVRLKHLGRGAEEETGFQRC
jgi:hypothetical protein